VQRRKPVHLRSFSKISERQIADPALGPFRLLCRSLATDVTPSKNRAVSAKQIPQTSSAAWKVQNAASPRSLRYTDTSSNEFRFWFALVSRRFLPKPYFFNWFRSTVELEYPKKKVRASHCVQGRPLRLSRNGKKEMKNRAASHFRCTPSVGGSRLCQLDKFEVPPMRRRADSTTCVICSAKEKKRKCVQQKRKHMKWASVLSWVDTYQGS